VVLLLTELTILHLITKVFVSNTAKNKWKGIGDTHFDTAYEKYRRYRNINNTAIRQVREFTDQHFVSLWKVDVLVDHINRHSLYEHSVSLQLKSNNVSRNGITPERNGTPTGKRFLNFSCNKVKIDYIQFDMHTHLLHLCSKSYRLTVDSQSLVSLKIYDIEFFTEWSRKICTKFNAPSFCNRFE